MYKVYLTQVRLFTPLWSLPSLLVFFPLILAAPFLLYSVHIVYLLFFSCFRECILRVERSSLNVFYFLCHFLKCSCPLNFLCCMFFSTNFFFRILHTFLFFLYFWVTTDLPGLLFASIKCRWNLFLLHHGELGYSNGQIFLICITCVVI